MMLNVGLQRGVDETVVEAMKQNYSQICKLECLLRKNRARPERASGAGLGLAPANSAGRRWADQGKAFAVGQSPVRNVFCLPVGK